MPAQAIYILTNQHVDGPRAARYGQRWRGHALQLRYPARLVAQDEEIDLALLQIDAPKACPPARDWRFRRLRVGELVMAVGHPWGQRGMVTAGLVSGLMKAPHRGRAARWMSSARMPAWRPAIPAARW